MLHTAMRDGLQSLQNLSAEDILATLGLQRRNSGASAILPSVAIFAAGAIVGATAAVLFAPKSGATLRRELTDGARDIGQKLTNTATSATGVVQDYIGATNRNHASTAT
jgi:hypothetical protein